MNRLFQRFPRNRSGCVSHCILLSLAILGKLADVQRQGMKTRINIYSAYNVHVSSESSEDEAQKKTVTHKDKTKSKIQVPKLSFEGEHRNGYFSQFELVTKIL